jgi:hypothetical protein
VSDEKVASGHDLEGQVTLARQRGLARVEENTPPTPQADGSTNSKAWVGGTIID